jgi:hypothetical protein
MFGFLSVSVNTIGFLVYPTSNSEQYPVFQKLVLLLSSDKKVKRFFVRGIK